MSFGDKGLCTIDPDYVPTNPLALVSIFNNLWTINFPYWIKGSFSSRVRIWATDNINDSSLVISATEARNPVLVGYADGKSGKLPAEKVGIELSRKGVLLSANFKSEEGTIIRVWDQTGTLGPLTITLPTGMKVKKAIPVNLRGTITGNPIEIVDRKLVFNLKAYAPEGFILQ
jgi:hypothetical protein